jgi:hypothetical protein
MTLTAALADKGSICSVALSTSVPRYRTVLSSFVCPKKLNDRLLTAASRKTNLSSCIVLGTIIKKEILEMKGILAIGVILILLAGSANMILAQSLAQDRYTLRVPDGLAFSEIRGYETWQDVAVSETQTSVKAILGNPAMIAAYKAGIPGNGKPFPDGVTIVKIEWLKMKSPVSPYFVEIPETLKHVDFIVKDSKRFPKTHGWAYAQFEYEPASKTFKPSVTGTECGYACHTTVSANDYIFTAYPPR